MRAPTHYEVLGAMLKALRRQRSQLLQCDACERLGISQASMSRIESGSSTNVTIAVYLDAMALYGLTAAQGMELFALCAKAAQKSIPKDADAKIRHQFIEASVAMEVQRWDLT